MSHTPEAVQDDLRLGAGRGWAVCGVGAAIFAAVGIGSRVVLVPACDPAVTGDAARVAALIVEHKLALSAFHIAGTAAAVLLIPFAAGLLRRLRAAMGPTSLAPTIAGLGVLVTSMVLVMGTVLDTEFGILVPPHGQLSTAFVSLVRHGTGTVPSLWAAVGLAGLAVFTAWRRGAVSLAQGIPASCSVASPC